MLKDSLHPATAIECGIMDSQADMSRLRDNKQQEAMCRNILSGVGAYERESQKR
ncbi:MAG: N-acetylmuramoyl-L-alanine amidase [Taibaiella sp.]|nr:N-acetylmuramoyl-L-alanine amidase [Taibaiella sp.]